MKQFFFLGCVAFIFSSCGKDIVNPPYKEQLAKDIASIDDFLLGNNIVPETDTSGLRYQISSKGSSFKPVLADSINVNYSLKLLTGQTVFANANNTLLLSKLIRAWRIVLPLVGEGAKLTLYIPSGLGYGSYRTGPIPANSNLIFDIELVKVIREYSGQLQSDKGLIDAFLTSNSITVLPDPSGFRYVINSAGAATQLAPVSTDSVVINYSSQLLPSQSALESAVGKGFKLTAGSTPKIWKLALPIFKEGTKATLYVPSGLAYGAYGSASVPPYSNLVYQVELVKVIRK